MGLYSTHIFPHILDRLMSLEGMMQARHRLLSQVQGQVLEVGFGTGLNLLAYPDAGMELVTVDVNPGVHKKAEARLAKSPLKVTHYQISGERLPMDDNTFDAVVSTWTLCSIPDVASALRQLHRVLKPGGKFHFVEHGLNPDPSIAKWQHRLTPLQKVVGDGCHLDRDIRSLIEAAGFRFERYENFHVEQLPRLGSYMYFGVATPTKTA